MRLLVDFHCVRAITQWKTLQKKHRPVQLQLQVIASLKFRSKVVHHRTGLLIGECRGSDSATVHNMHGFSDCMFHLLQGPRSLGSGIASQIITDVHNSTARVV
eukprot:TRINITY_DN29567_c0_g1_i1.p1 TRINITY_DN29567_c0_g1~~TRINITY_DN29567_c0_g1_i1.p1  ORF type:complete len:103 (-),score=3.70 TRINITY_DN29567_c0_g1_i1:1159-1467(-)